ncbi:MAG: leucine-rich repeat domain-containing protein [Candidatus Poribacteria bacterium]|nr:leucine-rich repeat domain-containing protein [Candidatus Poribacteria bacterium]
MKKILCKSLCLQLTFISVMGMFVYNASIYAEAAEAWMPDPILRMAVRQELKIDADTPLTKADMSRLLVLASNRVDITAELSDLTGLEYAVNLHSLLLWDHRVRDLRPIADLTNLRFLGFNRGPISDITPLAGLVNLETLTIWGNQIVDVSPLANLVNLRVLKLAFNQIEDFSPLAELVNLEWLEIQHNRSSDISEIPTAKLTEFVYDETCNVPGIPFADRIENREYPSVFGSWAYVPNKLPVILRPETSEITPMAYFDLHFGSPQTLQLEWAFNQPGSGERVRLIAAGTANIEDAKQRRKAILAFNPNAILLVPIRYYSGLPAQLYPEDGVLRDLYLRDKNGNRIIGGDGEVAFLDFTLPETQEFVFDQVRAIKACGLFDGIFFDHWSGGAGLLESRTGRTQAEGYIARDRIIQGARAIIGDDMLIMVNTGESKIPRWAEYINGAFIETHPMRVEEIEGVPVHLGYTLANLLDIEDTLVWSESNFREPRINSLNAFTIDTEPPDSPRNKQWMRTFTTMSLTLSDGYVNYLTLFGKYGPEVYWHPFYDAPLGRPIGEKGQPYKNGERVAIEGVFIREYTNGWAVYNRSGKEQQIELPENVSGVASGVEDQRSHTLPDLDGEIYLKSESGLETPPIVDVNGDGTVNIQDLVIVANALGEAEPDLNGDGVVNIQDLVIVANAF